VNERFTILNPCAKGWSELSGDGRKRFCPECRSYVYALGQYTAKQIAELRREGQGRVCGYLPGTLAAPPRSRRAILVGLLLTAISPLMAKSGRVRFRVTDQTGAMVAGAEISVLDKDGKPRLTLHTDGAGAAVFTNLPIGVLRFTVASPSFHTVSATVTVTNGKEEKVWATLRLGGMLGETVVGPPAKYQGWWIF
jgi:hypothetical protein